MSGIRGRIVVIAKAIEPIHHGGDKSGNEVLYRTQPIYTGGITEEVPIVSGNSLKHLNREGSSRFALAAMGLEDLTEREINLLFSGGTLTKSGQSVRMDEARKVEEVLPGLGLHGYACGNVMQESQVNFGTLELACDATRSKLGWLVERHAPELMDRFEDTPDEYLSSYFGTNHEPSRRRSMRELMHPDVRDEIEGAVSDDKDKGAGDKKRKSTQMIFGYQCLMPGAVLVGTISLKNGVKDRELQALRSGFSWASEGEGPNGGALLRFGGKGATGHGLCEVRFFGELARGIEPPTFVDTPAIAPSATDDDLSGYAEFLANNTDTAKSALEAFIK